MTDYRTNSHSRFDLKYHFVWVTKYRKPLLTDAVSTRVRDLVREICKANDVSILQGAVSKDHVHILVSCPPNISPSIFAYKRMSSLEMATNQILELLPPGTPQTRWRAGLTKSGEATPTNGYVAGAADCSAVRDGQVVDLYNCSADV